MTSASAVISGRLVEELTVPTYREGRVTTLQRWFRWLEDQDGLTGHPLAAVWAAILAARTGRPVEADRWADVADRWRHQTEAQPDSPVVAAWAAVLRALLCRHGVKQMSADADEAARRLAAAGIVAPVAPLVKGIAQVLDGDPDGGDASFENAISIGDVGAPDVLVMALCERSLLAMARHDWGPAHLALADTAGARTLMREIDGVLKRRPDLGTLVSDAQALRVRLTQERGSNVPGPSALTTAELRVLPLLATHLSFREIGAELFLSPNTVKSQAISLYRKLAAANRSQAVIRARGLGLLEG